MTNDAPQAPMTREAQRTNDVRVASNDANILIVEDDEGLSRLLQKRLQREGFQTKAALTAEAGLAEIAKRPPRLLLLDYRLPDMTGKEFIEALAGQGRAVPFIIITGSGDERVATETMKLGARDYMVKDAGLIDVLPEAVRKVIEQLAMERELVQAQEALRESEEKFRTLYDSSQDAIMIMAPERDFLSGNPAAVKMFRSRNEQEFTQQSLASLSSELQPDQTPSAVKAREMMGKAMRDGSHFFEWKHRRLDGEEFYATVLLTRMELEDQPVLQATVRDVTQEKEVDRMKSEFVSMASHELRTPLTNIQEATAQVLDGLYGEINPEQRSILGIAHRNCERLGRIIRDFLDISRIEAGKIVLNRSFVDTKDLVKKAIGLFDEPAKKKGVALTLSFGKYIPKMYGDPDRLEQIIVNLVGNALKFTPEGGAIGISAEKENGYIKCSVSDTGIGIAAKNMKELFTKFRQFSEDASVSQKGTGLGLVITKELVELHGGEIWAESTYGKGSCFSFKLPDYRDETSLRDYLEGQLLRARREKALVSVLGVALRKLPALKKALGKKAPNFFERLNEIMGADPDGEISYWRFERSGKFIGVLYGRNRHEAELMRDKVLKRLSSYLLSVGGHTVEFSFAAATATHTDTMHNAATLIQELREQLSRQRPTVKRAKRILIVDDERAVGVHLAGILKQNHFEPVIAYSGRKALDRIAQEAPDLIIMDLVMPGMSGHEVLGHLKERQQTSGIPVVIMSAFDFDKEELEQTAHSALPILQKPVTSKKLMQVTQKALGLKTIDL